MDPNVLYSGIWIQDPISNRILTQASLDVFKTKWAGNRVEGFHLESLDTSGAGDTREFSGVFVQNGDQDTEFEAGLTLAELRSRHSDLELKTIIAYSEGGTDVYAGAWAKGTTPWKVEGNLELGDFGQKIKGMRQSDFHLFDFQTCLVSNERRWTGLWKRDSSGLKSEIWVDLDQVNFLAKRKENADKGLHLVKMKTYRNEARTRYAGIWHSQGGTRLFFPDMGFDTFRNKVLELREQGFRLADLDARSLEDGADTVEIQPMIAVTDPKLDTWISNARKLYAQQARLNLKVLTPIIIDTAHQILHQAETLGPTNGLTNLINKTGGFSTTVAVVYIVKEIKKSNGGPINGVTVRAPSGIAISNTAASPWTLAHELGHLLMGHDDAGQSSIHPQGGHFATSENLMFRSTNGLSPLPPSLIPTQINIMKKSPFVLRG